MKNKYIYWRWKHNGASSFSKSYVAKVEQTTMNDAILLLTLVDSQWSNAAYGLRVLTNEIEIVEIKEEKE